MSGSWWMLKRFEYAFGSPVCTFQYIAFRNSEHVVGGFEMTKFIITVCVAVSGVMLASCGAMIKGDPKWEMPIVSKNCRSIDGYYYAYSPDSDSFLTNELWDRSSDRDEKKFSYYTSLMEIKEEPYTRERANWRKKNEYPHKILQIEENSESIKFVTYNVDRQAEYSVTVDLRHARVGCNQEGDLTTHWLSLNYGAELTPSTASAKETSIKKLSDGRLQVKTIRRTWVSNMNNPPDSRREKVVVFERVR